MTTKKTPIESKIDLILQVRKDPRQGVRKRKKTGFEKFNLDNYPSNASNSKKVIGKLIYVTRVNILECSHEVMAKLLYEDIYRTLLKNGASEEDLSNLTSVGGMTLGNIERGVYKETIRPSTVNKIVGRLLDWETGNAFEPLDFQAFLQDLRDDSFDESLLDYLESDEYIENSKALSKDIDIILGYRSF